MRTRCRTVLPGLALAWSLASSSALASESYPRALERALDMPCPPDCTVCHTSRSGGPATANTPLGISTRRAGLECCDTGILLDVVATLESNATDSDGDGTADVDELRAGTDPNAAEGELACLPPEPDDGCEVRDRSGGGRSTPWVLAAFVLGVLGARRRVGRGR